MSIVGYDVTSSEVSYLYDVTSSQVGCRYDVISTCVVCGNIIVVVR